MITSWCLKDSGARRQDVVGVVLLFAALELGPQLAGLLGPILLIKFARADRIAWAAELRARANSVGCGRASVCRTGLKILNGRK